ncbi:MAG: hypothetical protein GXP29_03350 [Planctomycetes bacterium]|nr:hypothetical protein [Planctomycetota bacterium]
MQKRSSKDGKKKDFVEIAKAVVDAATSEDEPAKDDAPKKNPAAVELGRLGGKKGGKARAAKMTPEERSEAAKKAANARWKPTD